MAGRHPMLRLLQGDVGSGKTAVAAYALAVAAEAGVQGALLAPTDLLARQHAVTLGDLLAPLGIPVTLLTGSLSGPGAASALAAIADGRAAVVVGTHALFSERVRYANLGLVVVDEQHRFGVEQRGALEAKTTRRRRPRPAHDRDADPADGRPGGLRGPRRLGPADRAGGARADPDRHPPSRRPGPALGPRPTRRPATGTGRSSSSRTSTRPRTTRRTWPAPKAEAERLGALLAPLRVGLVHGRMKAAARDEEMARFRDGGLDVLVGTTVVEVGVDVPEASVMIVEGADRFGLAQLHQLRGRVGRGTASSYCVLVHDGVPVPARGQRARGLRRAGETTEMRRLLAVARTTDGFELAETDFALRREGDVLGLAQSGLPAAPRGDPGARRTTASWPWPPVATRRRCWTRRAASGRPARRSPASSPRAGSRGSSRASRPRGPDGGGRLGSGRGGDRGRDPARRGRTGHAAAGGPRQAGRLRLAGARSCPGRRSSTCAPARAPRPSRRSRAGAARAVLVERDAGAVGVIRENLRRTGLAAAATVVRRDAVAALRDPAPARRSLRPRDRGPPVRGDGAARRHPRPPRRGRRAAAGGRHRRRDRLLARAAAGRGGAATIHAGPPLRRDRDHLLPPGRRAGSRPRTDRRRDAHRGLPRIVRPDHARARRRPATRRRRLRPGRRRRPRQPAQGARRRGGRPGGRDPRGRRRDAPGPRRADRGAGLRRADGRRLPGGRRPATSCAGCGRSPTSRRSCRWPT